MTKKVFCGSAVVAEPMNSVAIKRGQNKEQRYDFDTFTLHAYQSNNPMHDACFVLETDKNLIAIESPIFNTTIEECKGYVAGLNKQLTDILISFHPGGGKWYGRQARIHTTETAKNLSVKARPELLPNHWAKHSTDMQHKESLS